MSDRKALIFRFHPGGLDIEAMNQGFGGAQPIFDRNVLEHPSCIGDHEKHNNAQLNLEDVQYYSFTEADDGPFWMTPRQRAVSKYDVDTGKDVTRDLYKCEIVEALRAHPTPPEGELEKRTAASLKVMAERLGIATKLTFRKIKEGWSGKAKGMAQVCWERRLIPHDSKKTTYTKGQLKALLSSCHDFQNELTLVEWIADQRGWKIIFSPKAHPEIAGVGIEYLWAVCKQWLLMIPLEDRKGREKFDEKFAECFGRDRLALSTVRGCARAARQYMQAYVLAHAEQLPTDQQASFDTAQLEQCVNPMPLAKITKTMKSYKSHRSVADINRATVRVILEQAEQQVD